MFGKYTIKTNGKKNSAEDGLRCRYILVFQMFAVSYLAGDFNNNRRENDSIKLEPRVAMSC